MCDKVLLPSREDADKLLAWAYKHNPGPWATHCQVTAKAAELIARKCGLNADRAYVSGLLHDIGYYGYRDGCGRTCHIYLGYELMMEKGYEPIAKICLSHSFPYQDIRAYGGSDMNCTDNELATIIAFLTETTYDCYDKLIQLCDCLGSAQGICLMERRMMDVVNRHGINEFTLKRWAAFFAVKDYFDRQCNTNIYNLFYDEIHASVFGYGKGSANV